MQMCFCQREQRSKRSEMTCCKLQVPLNILGQTFVHAHTWYRASFGHFLKLKIFQPFERAIVHMQSVWMTEFSGSKESRTNRNLSLVRANGKSLSMLFQYIRIANLNPDSLASSLLGDFGERRPRRLNISKFWKVRIIYWQMSAHVTIPAPKLSKWNVCCQLAYMRKPSKCVQVRGKAKRPSQ